ncbi:MAG TPA: beta-xylosidase [Terracidiphilus sp.]|nr:beta-xylosidase [Terracidiphilus sp.]
MKTQIFPHLLLGALALVAASPTAARSQAKPAAASSPVLIRVHAGQSTGAYTPIWNFFGADEPNYIYAPYGEKLLRELSALSPVPVYFRAHNLLTTGNGERSLKWGSTNVYTERPDGSPVYDFAITDRIFDALLAAHVRPLVEIGFMPKALSTHPDPYRHDFPHGSIFTGWSYPPNDWNKWSALILAYATHLRQRYGAQTATWYWEVWNEPDIPYWHGTPEEYDRLYDLTAAAIRKAIPEAKVGGPAATGIHPGRSEEFLRQFLEHCANGANAATGQTGAPLDFISYHPKGHPTVVDGHLVMSVGAQLQAARNGMRVISSYAQWRNTPIILTESDPEGCAACLGATSNYRNIPLYGASVTEATMRTYDLARQYGVNVAGSVTWAFEYDDQPAFTPFRTLATDGIDKPVLNAFKLMGKLGGAPGTEWLATDSSGALPLDEILEGSVKNAPDINAVATRDSKYVNILLWNYHDADLPAAPAQVRLTVDGISGDAVRESQFRMDSTHSDAYPLWVKMGSPAQPTAQQQAQLEKAGQLAETVSGQRLSVHAGKATIDVTLPRDAVVAVQLSTK